MIGYIIVCVLCSLPILTSIIISLINGKFHLKNIVITVILSLAIAFIFINLTKMRYEYIEEKTKEWNNGYCTECGGKYRLNSVVCIRKGVTRYYYICDKCGKVTEQRELR